MSNNLGTETSNVDDGNVCNTVNNNLLSRIDDFIVRLDLFSWGLVNYYTDVYLTTDMSRSLELMNYKNRKYRALMDLDELKKEIETFQKVYGQDSLEINNASKKLDDGVDSFNNSCTLVEGTYVVQAAARDLKSLKYVDAITKLQDLHRKINQMHLTGDLATAVSHFRTISQNQLVTVQGKLNVEWSKLFKWNFNRTLNTLKFSLSVQQKDLHLLKTVVTALYEAEQIVVALRGFSEFFILDVLPNIIKYNCEISIEDSVGALVFTIKIDLPGNGQPSIPTIFNNLTAVFEFLESTVAKKLEPEYKFIKTFGDCNRDDFFSKIINDCIKRNLPSCENSTLAYREIVLELETFHKFLVDVKYVEVDESPVKKYIDNVDLLLYDTKCTKLLIEARELFKENILKRPVLLGKFEAEDFHWDELQETYDLPIFFPYCMVSENIIMVGALIKKHLEECLHLPVEYRNQFAFYVKDIAVMYECVVAERNTARLRRNAFEIALYFNNCNYLAHTMVAPSWKNILPRDVSNSANTTLMPHIYDLRFGGIVKLLQFTERKKEFFSKIIKGSSIDPIENWNRHEFEMFNRDLNSVIRCLEEIRDTWVQVLPAGTFQRCLCTLVTGVCDDIIDYVFQRIGGTTENILTMLQSCLESTSSALEELFSRSLTMQDKVANWIKFMNIQTLLRSSLMDIGDMWTSRDPKVYCFSCETVRGFIKMRFPKSKQRLKILNMIQ